MRFSASLICAGILLCGNPFAPAWAQQAIPTAELPAKITLANRKIDVAPDGTSTSTSHTETKVLLQSGIALLSQVKVGYSDLLQQVDVTEAYTLKANGQKIPVAPDAIIVQQAPASAASPFLSDQKQKIILFPNVEVGDTLVSNMTTTSKPEIAGNFTYDTVIPAALELDEATMVISVPKALAPAIDAVGLSVVQSADDAHVIYTLKYSSLNPKLPAPTEAAFDLQPRLSISTFKDYDALAAAYAKLALPAIAVTPAIQAKADEITAGISGRREQAQKIYEWVSLHVRYIAIEFGQGAIVPHNADQVLTNAYGDCKDHAALFAALLKAKKIDSNLALINGTNGYALAKVPTLSPFNHVITWLPEFRVYADTTNGRLVPFGELPLAEYGKPVLHIGANTGALQHTPLTDTAASGVAYKLLIVADDPGHVASTSSITGTGDFASILRVFGSLLQGQDGGAIAGKILAKSPNARATGMLTAPPPDVAAPSYQISGNYSTPGVINGLARNGNLTFWNSLKIVGPFGAEFFGVYLEGKDRTADAAPCYNGHAVDDETFQYPVTRHLVGNLPADAKLTKAHVTYTSHWSTGDNSVSVHREFSSHFDSALCSGEARDELLTVADQIATDSKALFSLPRVKAAPAEGDTPPESPN